MKRINRFEIVLCVVLILLLSACASRQDSKKGAKGPKKSTDYPAFFLTPPSLEEYFVGLGMAKLADDNLSRTTALARARADIAAQVSVSVETMLTDYAQESGADTDVQTITFIERISKEVADIELQGAITKEQYPAKDGTWYVMVHFPKDALIEEVGNVFIRNEEAAFAEFKAQQALERLNAEVANNPPRSAAAASPVNQ